MTSCVRIAVSTDANLPVASCVWTFIIRPIVSFPEMQCQNKRRRRQLRLRREIQRPAPKTTRRTRSPPTVEASSARWRGAACPPRRLLLFEQVNLARGRKVKGKQQLLPPHSLAVQLLLRQFEEVWAFHSHTTASADGLLVGCVILCFSRHLELLKRNSHCLYKPAPQSSPLGRGREI